MSRKKIIRSQFKQILFIIAAFFLMVTLGGFFVSSVIRKQSSATVSVALQETEKTIRAYLREPKIAFDNIYTAVADMLDRGDSQEAVKNYLAQTADMLTGQENGIQGFTAVYGFIGGEFLSNIDMGEDYVPQQRPWYQTAIRSSGAEYTAPYTDLKTGLTILSLTREIYGKSGKYYGVMALDIDISWLTEYAESLSFTEGGYGMIVNQHLYTLAHPLNEYRNVSLQELGEDYAEISDMLRTDREVSAVNIKDTDGGRVIVFFKKLYNGWFVGVVMPVDSYYSELYTAIFVLAVLGIVLAAILSCIMLRLSGDKIRADEENRAKTSFLARMSHEIRTPLNAIIGIAQIELQNGGLPEERAAALEKIYNSGGSLLVIINDILDMSKIESGRLELNVAEYDMPSLINDAVQMNVVRIGQKPIRFILEVDENLPSRLFGDELRIKQILNSLLTNAVKNADEGGVKLTVTHSSHEETVILRMTAEYGGRAADPDDFDMLITRKLVAIMGGETEEKDGAFTVTVKQKNVAESTAIGADLADRLRGLTYRRNNRSAELQTVREPMPYGKVLVVDDVETNLYVAESFLAPYKIKTETAMSGFEALDKVNGGKVYDIVFMDHMMPIMDGIETVRKMRAGGYDGAIVALTANALVGNEKLFAEKGFDGFIPKPIDSHRLDEVLNEFIRSRHPEEAGKHTAEPITATKPEVSEKLLQIFRRDAEKAINTLRETIANGDAKLYTTTVHAMKSALANVGEQDKSDAAARLERAGRDGDTAYIKANTEVFIKMLERLTESIPQAAVTDTPPTNMSQDYLKAQLALIEKACHDYDDETAYAALDRIKDCAAAEEIRDMLFLHSDFDGAAEAAAKLITESTNKQ